MPEPTPSHEAAAALPEDFGGRVPAHHGDPHAEYAAARDRAAVFDQSHRGKVEAVGKETLFFLHNLSTNDIKNLAVGHGCEAFLANAKARALAHVYVFRLPPETPGRLWLDAGPGLGAKVFKHLDRHLISEQVELADRTHEFAQAHLCGPEARAVLERALGSPVGDLGELQHEERPLGPAATVQVRRHDLLELPGYDLLWPAEGASAFWEALVRAGALRAGREAFEVLRVEAGLPLYGIEMDEDRFVVEVGRTAKAISYTKGCYLGQEPIVMARDRGHVNRALLGLTFPEDGPVPRGAKVFQGTQEVGQVTSSVVSPRLGKAVALAYLRRGHQTPGTALDVEVEGARRPALVTPLPLVPGRDAETPRR
jgi:folate-binding protein YgfZ